MRTLSMLLALALAAPAAAATYEVDPVHSQIGFSVTHMMVTTARGAFGTVSGTVEYDAANVAATKVSGTVGVASVDTNNADREKHLLSDDFFAVAKFPEMKFVSKAVKNIDKDRFDLVGDLTIKGITREVVFSVHSLSPEFKDPWGNVKAGTAATTTISRKDFGFSWNTALDQGGFVVGDDVAITLDLELVKK